MAEKVAVQVLESVTVKVTAPGHKLPIDEVAAVEGVEEAESQEKVYGDVPPVGDEKAEPLQEPLQVILLLVPFANKFGGCVKLAEKNSIQPLTLVVVTV